MEKKMTVFEYSGFYDVPRCISIWYRGIHFLLQSWFDEDLDEYPNAYSVYAVPAGIASTLAFSPELLRVPLDWLGQLPINQVVFDPSKRKELDASVLESFVALVGARSLE